jgi:transposase
MICRTKTLDRGGLPAIGKKRKNRRQTMWFPHTRVARNPGPPFCETLDRIPDKEHFAEWLEPLCEPFFRQDGRPSIPPGVCFRTLMTGYFGGDALR